jgi:hypothetical protein
MKKYISIILVTLLSMGIIDSCKKDSTSKDYTNAIKSKTWWGTLTNPGETAQYYSVYFNADNSLVWSQQSGNYTGKWTINGKQLTLDFVTPAVQVKADISDDNTLKNIVTNNSSVVNSGKMIVNQTASLDNTVWKGLMSLGTGQQIFQLSFMIGSKVEVKVGATTFGTYPYTRSVSGVVIQFSLGAYPYFGIISSDNEMKGHWRTSTASTDYFLWQTTKQ